MKRAGVTFRFPEKLPPYEDALRLAGVEPVRISPEHPRDLYNLDGLLLTGGTDIDPALYGEPRDPHTEDPDRERDHMERRLLFEALAADLPVLCICRGLQLFNVALGGTLVQHLEIAERHLRRTADASEDVHMVQVPPRTRLGEIIGAGEHAVNSRHHQAVAQIAKGLLVSAYSDDGLVEALELPGKPFALAVQWHPEDRVRTSDKDRRLFTAFAEALGTP